MIESVINNWTVGQYLGMMENYDKCGIDPSIFFDLYYVENGKIYMSTDFQ